MKTIKTLIKVQKQKLDMVRRNLVSLETQMAQLNMLNEKLEKDLAAEIELADKSAELSSFFGDYIKRIRARQERLRKEIRDLDVQVEMAREVVRHDYGEQLKYEKILENKMIEAKREADRKEGIELDDIAANQHARKEDV